MKKDFRKLYREILVILYWALVAAVLPRTSPVTGSGFKPPQKPLL